MTPTDQLVRLVEATGELTLASLSDARAVAVDTLREMAAPEPNPLNAGDVDYVRPYALRYDLLPTQVAS